MVDTGRVISTAIQFIDGFTNPSRQVIGQMRRMGNEAIEAGRQIQKAGKTIESAGSALTKSVTMPIAGVATAAFKMSSDFENSMAKVSTIADTSTVPMEALKNQVIELSNAVGVGVSDIAEAQYQAISAGVDTASSVDFVSVAVKAAKGGFTDTATAVDGLTTVLNAYGMEANKAADISDQMLMAQNYGKTSFGEMAGSLGQVIPIAASLNVSTEDLFGSIAALTKQGAPTSSAMTKLTAAYSNILKPSAEAGKTAKQLGLDFSAAHLQSVGWAAFLDEIKEKTGGNQETMAKLFGSTEALQGVTVLTTTGCADFAEAIKLVGDAGGSTEAAYQKMLTPTERMHMSFNKIKNSLIQFGVALTPAFEKAAEVIGKVGDRLNGLSEGQVNSIVKFAGIAAAIGPALMAFGKVVTTVGSVKRAFGTIRKTMGAFKGIAGLVTSPAGIVIGVLAAIALAAVLVIKNWDKIGPVVMKVKDWFVGTFGGAIKDALGMFKDVMGKVTDAVKEYLPLAIQKAKGAITTFKPVINTLIEAVKKVAPVIKQTFITAMGKLAPVLKTAANAVKAAAPVIGKLLSNAFSFAGRAISKIMPVISRIAQAIGGVIVFAVRKAAPVVVKFADTFSKVFAKAVETATRVAAKIRPAFEVIGTVIKTVAQIVGTVIGQAFHVAEKAVTAASGSIKQVIGGVMKVFEGIIDFVGGVFTGNWRQAWEGVKEIFGGTFEALAGLCKVPINAVIGVINGAINGINSINVAIPEWVPGLGGQSFGLSIPTIPLLYRGTDNWKGGMAMIHDRGGEIVDLPRGSRVYPHDKSVEMARKEGERQGPGSVTVNIQKLADRIEVRSEEDIDRIAEALAYKLKKVAFNTGAA